MSSGTKDKEGRIFCRWAAQGINFPRKKTPIMGVDGCNDIIIVSSDYFLTKMYIG
jgi:hypothetical protein